MALAEYKKGSVICSEGGPIDHILFITSGSVEALFGGRKFALEQGDMIGVCDLNLGIYSSTYTAVTDVVVFSHPYKNLSALEGLLQDKADIAPLLVKSMCRQLLNLLQLKISLKNETERAYDTAKQMYPQYEEACDQYAFTAKQLQGAKDVAAFMEIDPLDEWVYTYYMGINEMDTAIRKDFFLGKPGITLGFIRKASEDAMQAVYICRDYVAYLKEISKMFLNTTGHDLFSLVSELHFDAINFRGADSYVGSMMQRLASLLKSLTGINPDYFKARLASYSETLAAKRENKQVADGPDTAGAPKINLTDSLEIILEFSSLEKETKNKFSRAVREYAKLEDRGSADDSVYRLRRELTTLFYELYTSVFIESLKSKTIPTVIKMFLNFGYVDAALAGEDNADYLYSIADSLKGDPEHGVYTAMEWLMAVYEGKKQPCRNELDDDFQAHVRRLRHARRINEKEEKELLENNMEKLKFELENVFPVANKVTCGIISTFCPLFSSHNVQRKLETSLVTTEVVTKTLKEIRDIDFQAYYRPVMYAPPELGNAKDVIHVEVLPDIILMPNTGIRGIAWQEIEGNRRQTPARMFLSVFVQSEIKNLLIRLTADFRWEMCKRIQGVRWNDLSDLSLTSEYVDYLQFYRNNRDLSQDVKEAMKNELSRARNNYKTVFSLNYADWMLYESNGASRLNKIARRLMLMYCPFPLDTRERLKQNPQFADVLSKFNLKRNQRLQALNRHVTKLNQGNTPVPAELLAEIEYAKR